MSREKAREATRGKLIAAARTCFAQHGFAGASVDVIAETAGYTKGAFYSNFDSKEAVFFLLLEDHLAQEIARGRSATAGSSFNEALNRMIRVYDLEGESQDWCLLAVEFALHAARSESFAARYTELCGNNHVQLGRNLTRLADLAGRPMNKPAYKASKFLAFRTGLALDRTAPAPSLTPGDVRGALGGFLRKVLLRI
ncbi:TetR/AcrR family transcriptional regulator [Chachezhania sediminis]|uniref:TetR/AcrR family transcriptional regulator n=1 Tax=Chachezhania sediminis TaxID=2599291 RepID=UPI00131D73EB|nr:TetR/AcrR family transcriptional regulator [Chachezhania sediminis]